MRKYFWLAIAICILFAPAISVAQPKPGSQPKPSFIIFLKESPPPDDPSDWFRILPTNVSAQTTLAAGFHPFKWANTEDEADLDVANLLVERFPQVCHKGTLRFVNPPNPDVFVEEFSAPKPFGFTYQGPPMCRFEARPTTVQVGKLTVILSQPPRIIGPVTTPTPPPPPPRRPVQPTPTPPQTETPPQVETPPQNSQPPGGGNPTEDQSHVVGPEPQPIPEDDTEGTYGGETAQTPQPIPNEGNTTSDQTSNNQNQSTTEERQPESKYPDMNGTWRRDRWTQAATQSVSQSGNRFEWGHDYPWGGGMRHEAATGTVEEIGGDGYAGIAVDIDYTEADGSHTRASYTGRVRCDANGKGLNVSWNNGSSWTREQ